MGRTISRIENTPPPMPGFIGEGHTAVEVVRPSALAASDPFVLLMDDRLDIARRRRIGGAHPHAGLETVTLVLEGAIHDRDEGELAEGDALWMTAGRGIVHSEAVEAVGRSRILQLWIALPARDRDLAPTFEVIRKSTAPVLRAPGVEARLYSGASGRLRSPTQNRLAVTILVLSLAAGATYRQDLPAGYNGFVYVVEGSGDIGGSTIATAQVGWLEPFTAASGVGVGSCDLDITAGPAGLRLVLYAGQPIGEPLVQQGPFVAGTAREISEFNRRFRGGQFTSMHDVARSQSTERQHA